MLANEAIIQAYKVRTAMAVLFWVDWRSSRDYILQCLAKSVYRIKKTENSTYIPLGTGSKHIRDDG